MWFVPKNRYFLTMKSLTKVLRHYFYAYADDVRKVTSLLHDYFGVEGFAYQKIDKNGDYIAITDAPELADHCFKKKVHLKCPFLRHPNSFQNGLIFNDKAIPPCGTHHVLQIGDRKYDTQNTVAMIEKNHNSVEMIYLIARARNTTLNTLAWRHQTLLKRYLKYFKNELKTQLATIASEHINLAELYPDNFFKKCSFAYELDPKTQYNFLKSLGCHDIYEKAAKLTCRERECLFMLLQGKTAKETAAQLKLSARTIEAYLEKMKTKLCCMSKAELFSLAQTLQGLDLLQCE